MSKSVTTEHFIFNAENNTVEFTFDGFLTPELLKAVQVVVAPTPSVLKDKGKQNHTCLGNVEVKYPRLPISAKAVMISNVVIVRPVMNATGEFGGSYGYKPKIGIPVAIADAMMKAAKTAGYKVSDEQDRNDGYQWISVTTDDALEEVFSTLVLSKGGDGKDSFTRISLSQPYHVLEKMVNDNHELCNVSGYALLTLRFKATLSGDGNISADKTKTLLEWSLMGRLHRYYIKDTSVINPRGRVTPGPIIDARMAVTNRIGARIFNLSEAVANNVEYDSDGEEVDEEEGQGSAVVAPPAASS